MRQNKQAFLSAAIASVLLVGCEKDGPLEQAGEELDQAVESARDMVDDRGPMERAGKQLDDAVESAGESIEQAGDRIRESTQ